MKLYTSAASPFARKVIVAALELGLGDQLVLETAGVSPVGSNPALAAHNPLGKIPTLLLEDGRALFDSRVIVDFLDSLTSRRLVPADGPERWAILTEQALADGLMDAALLARYESALRPPEFLWKDWLEGQMTKIRRGLDHLETAPRNTGPDVTLADIAVACVLGYLDYRFADEDWRSSRPRLAAFYAEFSSRPSWLASRPDA